MKFIAMRKNIFNSIAIKIKTMVLWQPKMENFIENERKNINERNAKK